jgi:mono/diheme cytochrome c family protein
MWRSFPCISLAALLCAAGPAADAPGRRLYREGILPSGAPLRAELPGGVVLQGAPAACVSCHRPSGSGGVEGQAFVPPVTAVALFKEWSPRRAELFGKLYQEHLTPAALARLHSLGTRPAYTAETLAAALRDGRDPTGRALDPLMPRYRLTDKEAADLAAYLHTLGAAPSPGADEREIHFATVFTPCVEPAVRQAVLGVLEAFLRHKNADTERLLRQPPLYKEDEAAGARTWVLHVWDLQGAPETWGDQLAARSREQPVFAVLSGAGGAADWAQVQGFCEKEEIPCLFPETDLPPAEPGAWAFYFSAGLTLEAETLARHLREMAPAGGTLHAVQLYRSGDPRGTVPAAVLRKALQGSAVHLEDRALAPAAPVAWQGAPDVAVLWLPADDVIQLQAPGPDQTSRLILSRTLLGETPPPAAWSHHVLLLDRFAPPGVESPHAYRARGWLLARGLPRTEERLQLDTWFTLSLTESVLMHLVDNLSREAFVETVERETERVPNPGVYVRLALGPGRRFASTSCSLEVERDPGVVRGPDRRIQSENQGWQR